MTELIIRVALRYTAGFLIARGFLSEDIGGSLAADADVLQMIEVCLGFLVGVAAEAWLYAERAFKGE